MVTKSLDCRKRLYLVVVLCPPSLLRTLSNNGGITRRRVSQYTIAVMAAGMGATGFVCVVRDEGWCPH